MNKLQRLLLVGALTFSLIGCKEYKREYSEVKNENAIVSLHKYVPERTNIDFDFDGEISIDTDPAEYNIEFKGKIIFKLNNKQVFDRFQLEDLVDVSYREIHGKTYGRDGKTRYLEKDEIVGNEFVNAQKR